MPDAYAARSNARTVPVSALTPKDYRGWLRKQSKPTTAWLKSLDFRPDLGKVALIPGRDGSLARVVLGLGATPDLWAFAHLRERVPPGRYAYEDLAPEHADGAALAWGLASYRFTRYASKGDKHPPQLVWPAGTDRAAVKRAREAITMGRDLINTAQYTGAFVGRSDYAGCSGASGILEDRSGRYPGFERV
ncbi:MAG: hypothetical protein KDK70_28585, partial [Myxococcales bacterium]|nr:hypothetical protein [Myxococcales bacterium]